MIEKELRTRMIQKHDIEVNWEKAINFIPKKGELIVYDPDENYNYSRVKIGDGISTANELPFIIAVDTSLTQSGQAADAKAVGDAISKLSGGNVNQGTGWTSEQIDILDSIGDHINFLDAEGGRLWDSLITALRSGQGSSEVLTSITAVYSGGSVEAGTQTRELKITVTATYDDGTSKTVTGYTLSPDTVSEGENTVTVTYNGKTSTFTVTGIVTPAEVVLESISAVFNGETAQAGTNASDLDITVTGHYSDGSTKTETGWTTAGTVHEGNNVFTIYLNDKTCTVSVVGVAVEEEPTDACYTKIATIEGQDVEGKETGMMQFDSSLIEEHKLYALVADTINYYKPFKFVFVTRGWDGVLNFGGAHKDQRNGVSGSETDGVITIPGNHYSRFGAGRYYYLYEIGKDTQVITDGQLLDYIGTIVPTQGEAMTNTLTIPASAFADNSSYAVIVRSWNTELDYTSDAYHYVCCFIFDNTGIPSNLNEDGTLTRGETNYFKLPAECNLVYDVYRANPMWG